MKSEKSEFYAPEIETMPREELEKLQLKRLKWQVKRCYQGSEFYRERFDKIGLQPGDIKSLDDVLKIPPVHKGELREEQINHPPFGRCACEHSVESARCGDYYSMDS